MTSYTRWGTTWAGAHEGLITGILRGEWGCQGMVLSDNCRNHMDAISGVAAGSSAYDDMMGGKEGEVHITILDEDGKEAAAAGLPTVKLSLPDVHLWNRVRSPYLYTAVATLTVDGQEVDRVSTRFGVRNFYVDPSGCTPTRTRWRFTPMASCWRRSPATRYLRCGYRWLGK